MRNALLLIILLAFPSLAYSADTYGGSTYGNLTYNATYPATDTGRCSVSFTDDFSGSYATNWQDGGFSANATNCDIDFVSGELRFTEVSGTCAADSGSTDNLVSADYTTALPTVNQWACYTIKSSVGFFFLQMGPRYRISAPGTTDKDSTTAGTMIGQVFHATTQQNDSGNFALGSLAAPNVAVDDVLCFRIVGTLRDTVYDMWRNPDPLPSAGGTPDDWPLSGDDHNCLSGDGNDVNGDGGGAACVADNAIYSTSNTSELGDYIGMGVKVRDGTSAATFVEMDDVVIGTCDTDPWGGEGR